MPNRAAKLNIARYAVLLSVTCMRYMFIYLLTICIALPPGWTPTTFFGSGTAHASSYPIAFSKYEKGDFKGAEIALRQSLKKKMSRADLAKTYKLLGICAYMLGNKSLASNSFRRALKLVPSTSIGQNEVLDNSVIGFFSSVKSGGNSATKVATKKSPSQPAPMAKTSPLVKKTYLKVLSNVATASVALDGILAGRVNTLINTDPGKIEIEVSAQGFITKKAVVNVSPNQENTVTVNLVKPAPKAKPKPKPKAKPQSPKQQKNQQLVQNKKKKQKKRPNRYTPDPGDDLFADDGRMSGPDPATQFEMDTGGGYTQPAYSQPPGYSQPPVYYAPPPPVYYAPPPQPYYVPPPPPPPSDPYGGGGYVDPHSPPVGPAPDPAAQASNSKKGSEKNLFVTLLPFGAGQFQNESYILGTAFLGAEAYALYYWYSKGQEATAFAANANKYLVENCSTADADDEKCEAYQNASQVYTDETNNKAQMGLYAFIGLWIVGVAEAIINEPTPEPKGGRRRKNRYSGIQYSPTPDGHHFSIMGRQYDNRLFAYDIGIDIAPTYSFESDKIENQLSLSLNLTF